MIEAGTKKMQTMREIINLYNKVQKKKVIKVIKIEKVCILRRRDLIHSRINKSINNLSKK